MKKTITNFNDLKDGMFVYTKEYDYFGTVKLSSDRRRFGIISPNHPSAIEYGARGGALRAGLVLSCKICLSTDCPTI